MSRRPLLVNWLLGLFFISSLSLTVAASEVLEPFSAAFKVKRNIIPLGRLTLKFNLDQSGTAYTYSAHTQPGMLAGIFSRHEVIEESSGSIQQGQIIPDHYTYKDGDENSKSSIVEFHWPEQSAATTSHGITWSQAITSDTQDKLSQQLQVRIHLAQGQRQISYQVADGGKLKHYHFEVVGEERVETDYGTYQCLRVERSKASKESDYTIWFAPELGYLPIKIERVQGGKTYRMVLNELSMP
ncbi:MAG: DUF3108 domain-containing protein [Candidatus Thiodiazotropha sp. 6PLUC2]